MRPDIEGSIDILDTKLWISGTDKTLSVPAYVLQGDQECIH